MASHYKTSFLFLFVSLQLLSWIEATNRKGGITVDFIHRDSPSSPSYSPSSSHFDRLKSSFKRSFTRKSSLHLLSTLKRGLTFSTPQVDISSPITANGGEYLMKVGVGTPPVQTLAIADTGSDLTWTQCKPCTNCYKQIAPLFDPKKSGSYKTIPCTSPSCALVGSSASCGTSKECEYQYSYGDSSYTIGDLSLETLTFDAGVSFPRVVFGCGHENAGTFSDAGSGLIGLGNGQLSIINQLSKSIGGKFSYCLTLIGSNATSKISLGSDSSVVGPNVVSTPLLNKSPDTFYYLTLEGLSVGNNRVSGYSSNASVGEGNIIIDSGTTLTFVPSDFYNGLESALVKAVKGTRVEPSSQGTFKLCYQKSSDFAAPAVTAHFTGADVVLTRESTFLEVEEGVLCLTLVPSDDLAIFGNLHQMNYEIGYDIEGSKLDFLATDCSKPTS